MCTKQRAPWYTTVKEKNGLDEGMFSDVHEDFLSKQVQFSEDQGRV